MAPAHGSTSTTGSSADAVAKLAPACVQEQPDSAQTHRQAALSFREGTFLKRGLAARSQTQRTAWAVSNGLNEDHQPAAGPAQQVHSCWQGHAMHAQPSNLCWMWPGLGCL